MCYRTALGVCKQPQLLSSIVVVHERLDISDVNIMTSTQTGFCDTASRENFAWVQYFQLSWMLVWCKHLHRLEPEFASNQRAWCINYSIHCKNSQHETTWSHQAVTLILCCSHHLKIKTMCPSLLIKKGQVKSMESFTCWLRSCRRLNLFWISARKHGWHYKVIFAFNRAAVSEKTKNRWCSKVFRHNGTWS